ncbi:MAG: CPBP family intramembrane metalloprotease [Gemmatimonadaceae bacterium]|nr:CPBP family intramembrane metalloprotease [Gemmatimonadaceae bacterium]
MNRSPPPVTTSYFGLTRAPRYSLTFALPLLLAYEVLAVAINQGAGSGIRNGADVLLRSLAATVFGDRGPALFGALVGIALAAVAIRDRRRAGTSLRPGFFVMMLAESAALALAFGVIVGMATAQLLDALPLALGGAQAMTWPVKLMISLGAGLYEELVFRVLLVSALLLAARRLLGWGAVAATTFAVVVGAVVFSAFHYIGPYGDPLELPSFLFRTIAGLAFSGLYVVRGFGITAWTHALYDVFLLAARG